MPNTRSSETFRSIWRNLKRALITPPDLQNHIEPCIECHCFENLNSTNMSNINNGETATLSQELDNISPPSSNTNSDTPVLKKQRLNLATQQIDSTEETSFMEIMKNLLSCSICLEVSTYSNQCPNGHLICITCSGRLQQTPGDLNCPVCRVSLKQGLHRSLLAEQLTSELPASCRFCSKILPVKSVKRHETTECTKRKVPCKYKIFGCTWVGIEETLNQHVNDCTIADKTVGMLHETVTENINRDMQLIHVPLQIWKSLIGKLRSQAVGSRVLLRQTTLNKSLSEEVGEFIFKSPVIRVPFSCCSLHGFYLDLTVKKEETGNDSSNEKLVYCLRSENKTKVSLNYFICALKIDETQNIEVQDSLHSHHYENSHKEGPLHEIKLISIDCDKPIPTLTKLENIFVEMCFISERERSERTHGILSSADDDETNPFITTSNSDSNVVFTLFSPSTSSTRSMNTSNANMNTQEDSHILNDTEPSHEEDIVITVTDNIDNTDEVVENRENMLSRNNHSFVAVPTVFFNPNPSMFTYSPYQLDHSLFANAFQPPTRITRELMTTTTATTEIQNQQLNESTNSEHDNVSNNNNITRLINSPRETIQPTFDMNRIIRDPMSMFYPPQTIVSPYLSNSMSPLAVRATIPRNIVIRPNTNTNQIDFQQNYYNFQANPNDGQPIEEIPSMPVNFNDTATNEINNEGDVNNQQFLPYTIDQSTLDLSQSNVEEDFDY